LKQTNQHYLEKKKSFILHFYSIDEDSKDFSQEYQPKSESSLEFKNGDASAKYSIVDSAEEVTLSLPHQSSAGNAPLLLPEMPRKGFLINAISISEIVWYKYTISYIDCGSKSTFSLIMVYLVSRVLR
jgi:hypothetical protein